MRQRRSFASQGDSFEIRESRGGPPAEPGDPDAAAYAEGAALPNPGDGAKLMSSTTSNVSPGRDTYWWQGSVVEIKARAEDAGSPPPCQLADGGDWPGADVLDDRSTRPAR
jgi:hypothetical protein